MHCPAPRTPCGPLLRDGGQGRSTAGQINNPISPHAGNGKLEPWKNPFSARAEPCTIPSARQSQHSYSGGAFLSRRTTTKKARQTATLDLGTIRVGVYLRRSTDDENQPNTIEAQDVRLKAYVASQPGWKIAKKFSDGTSGKDTDRQSLHKAMHWAKSGLIDVLLVYRVDRIVPVFRVPRPAEAGRKHRRGGNRLTGIRP